MEEVFPGGPVVKNSPSIAGDMSSISGWGTEIRHAAGQLGLCIATTEPTRSGDHANTSRSFIAMKDPAFCSEDPICHS